MISHNSQTKRRKLETRFRWKKNKQCVGKQVINLFHHKPYQVAVHAICFENFAPMLPLYRKQENKSEVNVV